jgi:SAM-dependent methyltransferase
MFEQDAVLSHLTDPTWFVLEVGPGGHPTPWSGPYESIDRTEPGQPGSAGSEAGVTCTATRHGEMHDLPYGDETFDALVARHLIEHHPDTLLVLREWARVLKPGGVLVIVTPDQRNFRGNTVALDPTHQAAFTAEQLQALAAHAGFGDFAVSFIDWPRPGWSFCLRAVRS